MDSDACSQIASLKNLGPKSAERIVAVGIVEPDQLRQLGAAEVFHRVEANFPNNTSLNLLWALQGAIMELDWRAIPDEIKQSLIEQINASASQPADDAT